MPPKLSRELVLKKLASIFPEPAIAKQALRSLDKYGKKEFQIKPDLVHLAILKLSGGELWRLRELVRTAQDDFRDVLYPAQSPEYFQMQRANPIRYGGLKAKKKTSEAKIAAMEKRDHDQWTAWITSA
jgi:hypothetical protein